MGNIVIGATLTADTGDANEKVKSFRGQLREAQNDVIALTAKFGATSTQATEAAKRAGDLYGQIQNSRKEMQAFNPEQKFAVFSQSISGVVGGFTALQGIIGLTGTKNEELEKTILKVQSAMALSQGLNQVQEAYKAFQRLGVVIQESTIFVKANETANKLAGAAMKLFGVETEATSTSFKVLKGAIAATGIGLIVLAVGEAISFFNDLANSADKAAEAEKNALELKEKYNKIGLTGNEAAAKRQFDLDTARAKATGASEQEIFDIKQRYTQKIYALTVASYNEAVNNNEDTTELNEKLKDLTNQGYVQAYDFQTAQHQKSLEENKKYLAKRLQQEKDAIELARLYAADAKQKQADEESKEATSGVKKTTTPGFNKGGMTVADQTLAESSKLRTAIERGETEERINQAKAEADAKVAAAENIGNSLGALSNLVGQTTEAGRVLALTQIGIDEAVAIAGAVNQATHNPLNITGFAFIADMAVRVTAIIAGISKAKQVLASSNSSGSSMPSFSNVSSQAPVSPTLSTTNTQLKDVSQQINNNGNAAIRAFVVESDVTNSQERVARINRAARIG